MHCSLSLRRTEEGRLSDRLAENTPASTTDNFVILDRQALAKSRMPDKTDSPRIAREKKTIGAMVQIYCQAHHRTEGQLCPSCQELFDYALCRLDRCPFGAGKPACKACPIHCYQPAKRAAAKEVMRYAGPRMILRHPILAVLHQLDGLLHRRPKR
jgi:hypothetical protein